MLTKDVETMAGAAQGKADICEHYPVKFFIRAIMAGFFIVVATILSNVSAAVLYSTYPQFGKLLGAFLFSIAIVLIVFIGGELFTGYHFLPVSFCDKQCGIFYGFVLFYILDCHSISGGSRF